MVIVLDFRFVLTSYLFRVDQYTVQEKAEKYLISQDDSYYAQRAGGEEAEKSGSIRQCWHEKQQCFIFKGPGVGCHNVHLPFNNQVLIVRHSPLPRRGKKGGDILGPTNPDRQRQEPDHVCPPDTDHGKMANMKW